MAATMYGWINPSIPQANPTTNNNAVKMPIIVISSDHVMYSGQEKTDCCDEYNTPSFVCQSVQSDVHQTNAGLVVREQFALLFRGSCGRGSPEIKPGNGSSGIKNNCCRYRHHYQQTQINAVHQIGALRRRSTVHSGPVLPFFTSIYSGVFALLPVFGPSEMSQEIPCCPGCVIDSSVRHVAYVRKAHPR